MRIRLFMPLLIILVITGYVALIQTGVISPAVEEALPVSRNWSAAHFEVPASPGRVIMVIMDYLQIMDLTGEMPPNLARLASEGAIALMNANTGGSIIPENTHATMGWGSHAAANNTAAQVFAASEKVEKGTASDEYLRRTGFLPPKDSLVYLDIARLGLINKKNGPAVVPGALGDRLHEAGYRTAVLGNSDDHVGPGRQAVSIVMDGRGIVDAGSVSNGVTRREKEFIGGISTDYEGILEEYEKLPADVKLVAVDLGDLSRLQRAREYMDREHWSSWRARIILRADHFLGNLMGRVDKNRDLIMLVCPTPGDNGDKKDRLSPVLMCGGGVTGGLLVTPTTRRPGIIMNVDIAPTVLNYLGLSRPENFTGQPALVIPGSFGIKSLADMYRILEVVYEARPFIQKGYVMFQLFLLAVSLCFIFLKKSGKDYLKPFFLSVMAVPLSYLLAPLLPPGGIAALGLSVIAITLFLAFASLSVYKRWGIDSFLFICAITMTAISADIVAGSPLQRVSVLGYDPIVGARFYGLGNEYMGVLIGSTLVGTTALIQAVYPKYRFIIPASGAVYLFITYLVAAPQLGTNVGGTLAAASAFLVTYLLIRGISINWRRVSAIVCAVALVALAFILYDSGRPPQFQSHIGRTTELINRGGLDVVAGIISRKSEMNIKLIRYTVWSRIFLASLAMLALLFYRPKGVMEGLRNRNPYLFRGLVGVITGSIVAFIFNDSGVVAAATTMIFGAPPLIYLVLEEMEGRCGERV